MAATRTQLIQSSSTTNTSAYDTGSISPTANTLLVLKLRFKHSTAGVPTVTVTSNAGLNPTWSLVKQTDFDSAASPTDCIAVFAALAGATPGTGTVHIATSIAASGMEWEIAGWDGLDLSAGTVAGVTVQTGAGHGDATGTTFTDTFGSAVNTNNAVDAVFGGANKNAPALTWNNSFTKDTDAGSGESTAYNFGTAHILSGFASTSHTATSATAQIWGMAGVEWLVATGAHTDDLGIASYGLTGLALTALIAVTLGIGSLGVTGASATSAPAAVTGAGTYVVTGAPLSVSATLFSALGTGAYGVTGTPITPVIADGLSPGAYSESGNALTTPLALAISTGSYLEAGLAGNSLIGEPTAPGAYSVAGANADESLPAGGNFTDSTTVGVYAVAGASLQPWLADSVTLGSYAAAGTAAAGSLGEAVAPGAHSLTGVAALTALNGLLSGGAYVIVPGSAGETVPNLPDDVHSLPLSSAASLAGPSATRAIQ